METRIDKTAEAALDRASVVGSLFRKTYLWMTMALVITALSALVVAKSPAMMQTMAEHPFLPIGLLVANFILAIVLAARVTMQPLWLSVLMFTGYAVLNGAAFSMLLFMYSTTAIIKAFAIAAAMFVSASIYGYVTNKDLSRLGNVLLMALIGVIIATVVNLFFLSSTFDIIVSYVSVVIFTGLVIYDTNSTKKLYAQFDSVNESALKIALLGAMMMYLDLLNLFLHLLTILDRD